MKDKAKASLDKLVALFSADNLVESISTVALIKRQHTGAPCEKWSLGNNLIMLMHDTTDARTFKQWKAVGRYPVKGSKAFQILRPVKTWITEEKDDGEKIKKQIIVGFAGVNVFRYEDTDGDPIERPDYQPVKLPPLADVAKRLGVSVDYAPGGGSVLGFYQPGQKHIRLLTHDESTWFHELAHAADDANKTLNGKSYKTGEVVAEATAATLCEMYGLATDREHSASKAYIEAYAGENAAKAINKVLSRVEKALDLILEGEEAAASEAA